MNHSRPLLLLPQPSHPHLPLALQGLTPWVQLVCYEPCAPEGAAQLAEAEGWRKRLGHEQMLLFGFAEGGLLALGYALYYPARVRGLILCSLPAIVEPFLAQCHFIESPTLILAGRHNTQHPPTQTAELCHAILPNSQLVVLDKSGPYPFVDEEGTFTAVIRTWLTQL